MTAPSHALSEESTEAAHAKALDHLEGDIKYLAGAYARSAAAVATAKRALLDAERLEESDRHKLHEQVTKLRQLVATHRVGEVPK